ncbi:MAG: hypothetical protein UZ18_ATM001000797 [Armatimonadetes bacterium OLB18]|nr:MAG: hypothetical protein UZ18_ATM001000797 [Armatimonadetes bacterium OLB18]
MNDKKKMIVIGVLGALLFGVGAFQFVQMGASNEPAAKKSVAPKEAAKKGAAQQVASEDARPTEEPQAEGKVAPEANPIQGLYALMTLPQRDPFSERSGVLEVSDASQTQVQSPRNPPPTYNPPRDPGLDPYRPEIGGTIPNLPGMDAGAGGPNPIPDPNVFAYRLSGVILGTSGGGVHRWSRQSELVPLGSSIDENSRVTNVSHGSVTVKHRGETITLNVGGTPNDN